MSVLNKKIKALVAGGMNAFRSDGYALSVRQPKELWEIGEEIYEKRTRALDTIKKNFDEKKRKLGNYRY